MRYAIERLLYRLANSDHASNFILKGATLFAVWTESPHRSTKDLDLPGLGSPDPSRLVAVFEEVTSLETVPDGITFSGSPIKATEIRGSQEYDGVRLTLEARVGTARIPVQVDIGFGDATGVPPTTVEVPPLLSDQPPPVLRGYSREVVVAEKFHAIVHLGLPNTRMKDYYDLLVLCRRFPFDGRELGRAVAATFERRGTSVPMECPDGLTDGFGRDHDKTRQWMSFFRRIGDEAAPDLQQVVREVRGFLLPVADGVLKNSCAESWPPGGPWSG